MSHMHMLRVHAQFIAGALLDAVVQDHKLQPHDGDAILPSPGMLY